MLGRLAVAVAAWVGVGPASAGLVNWTVDTSSSFVALAVPDQVIPDMGTLRVRNQVGSTTTAWNIGNRSPLAGSFTTNWLGNNISFVSDASTQLYSPDLVEARPNPAAFDPGNTNDSNPDGQYSDTSTMGAALGGRLRASVSILTVDFGFFAVRDAEYSITSAMIPLTPSGGGLTFPSSGMELGATGNLYYDGLSVFSIGQLVPDMFEIPTTVYAAQNHYAGPATLTALEDNWWRMVIPINTTVTFLEDTGFSLTGTVTGHIQAYAQYTPSGGIINGDFETGDLTGWEHDIQGDATLEVTGGGFWGNHAAVMNMFNGSVMLSQEFYADEGMLLELDGFAALTGPGYAHLEVWVQYLDGDPNELVEEVFFQEWAAWAEEEDGGPTSGGWYVPYTTTRSGRYLLVASAAGMYGEASVDNFRLTVVPEPGTWVLSIGALATVLPWAWRRRRPAGLSRRGSTCAHSL